MRKNIPDLRKLRYKMQPMNDGAEGEHDFFKEVF